VRILRFLWRFRSHPEALEPFLASIKDEGVPEANLSNTRNIAIAWLAAYHDRAARYRLDRYLLAGMGAVDLVLIPVIFPMGVPDRPLFFALLSLVISLALVSWSLFLSFAKQGFGITVYGTIHSGLVSLSLFSGVAALTLMIWHISSFIGVVFLILAVLAYVACTGYVTFMLIGISFLSLVQAASTPPNPDTGAPNSSEPNI
jgi:hypothetical protein